MAADDELAGINAGGGEAAAMWDWASFAAAVSEGELSGATLVALLAGVGGTLTGVGALIVQHRNSRTAATTGYVDDNLKAMQAVIALHEKEAKRLRAADNEKRLKIIELEAELAKVRAECETCNRRLNVLEGKDSDG